MNMLASHRNIIQRQITQKTVQDRALINKVLKVRVMKQMVWAVFLHGAEGWTIKSGTKK